ncbi:MAG: type II toxin-antitoxin system RelE/ParE family toxin [Gemmatimonadaceae bacterium]|nr:type II toxin-antitoxin system RelE/ParE family toxin [Gemmatimonadaceae bacterium]
MPPCDLRRYQDLDGHVPFDTWLSTMTEPGKAQNLAAAMKIAAALQRLASEGHALRRPTSAPLRDGVHELRVEIGRVNYRALYFFAGEGVAVIAHGCTKEAAVDEADIDRAVLRRRRYMAAPRAHTAPSA